MDQSLLNLLQLLELNGDYAFLTDSLSPYQLKSRLAFGRMAMIYAAEGPSGDAILKFPSSETYGAAKAFDFDLRLQCLEHESEVLRHCADVPHIVALLDDRSNEELPFIVLEPLGGEPRIATRPLRAYDRRIC